MNNNLHQRPRKSKEHQLLHHLQHRKTFTPEESAQYDALEKGILGEIEFHDLVTNQATSGHFLFDFLFSTNSTEFQIDSLSIEDHTLSMYEIKNFKGDYLMDQDKWFFASNKKEVRNPFLQLQRSEFLLRDLLRNKYPNLTIKSYLVFVHKEFMLYQAPLGIPAIFPTQLSRFQHSIAAPRSDLSPRVKHIADHLSTLHLPESAYAKRPAYTYDELRKGILCGTGCEGFLGKHSNYSLICPKCKKTQTVKKAIYENIKEFHFLFPERMITTGEIFDWCDAITSKHTIRQVLHSHFKIVKKGKHTYYLPLS